MNEVWWKATLLGGVPSVEPVPITKSTATTVFLPGGKQERIVSSWHWYADTRSEAIRKMLSDQYAVLKEADKKVRQAKDMIGAINRLRVERR